ncbi:MAG: hydrolase, partial [Streptomyces sp.]|nr:hydrolase [Streptomyces sp.]
MHATEGAEPVPARIQDVDTPAGPARVTWYGAARPRGVLALGHGAGGGIEAADLGAL